MNIVRKRLEKTYLHDWENHGRDHSNNEDGQKGEGASFTSSCVALGTIGGVAVTGFALQRFPRRAVSNTRVSLHDPGRSLERLGGGGGPRKREKCKKLEDS